METRMNAQNFNAELSHLKWIIYESTLDVMKTKAMHEMLRQKFHSI